MGLERRLRAVWVGLGLAILPLAAVAGTPELLGELERLRNSLPLKDSGRPVLTLRLADRLFEAAGEISRNVNLTEAQAAQAAKYRKRSIELYQEALSGAGGLFPKPEGELKTKIDFQLARLHSDLGQMDRALALWQGLVAQTAVPAVRREAALRLAEHEENSGADARALEHFTLALNLCAGGDVCSFARYRRAWIFHRSDRHAEALAEMKQALYDSRGQLREESLRDYVVFFGKAPGDGQVAFVEIEALAQKLNRPKLLSELAFAYYAAGNKAAGTFVLEQIHAREPSLASAVRLMEEFYGARRYEDFRRALEGTDRYTPAMAEALEAEPRAETEAILRRLTVQLDGARVSQPEFATDFKASVLFYLRVFPATAHRSKMMDGWIAAETDPKAKLDRLAVWSSEEASLGRAAEASRLREMRAAIAQKAGQHDVVAQEMAALGAAAGPKQREYRYLQARALYERKDYAAALPMFQSLAQPTSAPLGSEPFSVESEHLALDILGQQKQYAAIVAQADLWLQHGNAGPKAAAEREAIQKIRAEARFQHAAVLGETPEALAIFAEFCRDGILKEKACANAKVLAVKLKSQSTLLSVLEAQGAQVELANEKEASGQFLVAAQIQEKLLSAPAKPQDLLRLSVLYELGGDLRSSDRLIADALAKASRPGPIPSDVEPLLWISLRERGLLKPALLKAPFSPKLHGQLAEELEATGQPTPETRKVLLASAQPLGPAWTRAVLTHLEGLYAEQAKIAFHGRNGQAKFEARIKKLQAFEKAANFYLQESDRATRVSVLKLEARASHEIDELIRTSPMPDGLDEAAKAQLTQTLAELAQPFAAKAAAFESLAREQIASATDPIEKAKLESILQGEADAIRVASAAPSRAPVVLTPPPAAALEALARDPSSTLALTQLKEHYAGAGRARLAAYFEGRLRALQGGASP